MKTAQVTHADNSIEEGETNEERGREYTMGGGRGGQKWKQLLTATEKYHGR